MLSNAIEFEVPAKWILAGEHAAIRGYPAVAVPHCTYRLKLKFQPRSDSFDLEVRPASLKHLLPELIQLFNQSSGQSIEPMGGGLLEIESDIPVGAGLGSSAALCVALMKWLSHDMSWGDQKSIEVARAMENHFHGNSSGIDVATVFLKAPILFTRDQGWVKTDCEAIPRFSYHDTSLRSVTRNNVQKVENHLRENPLRGRWLDEKMAEASELAWEGLKSYRNAVRREESIDSIAEAMNRAQDCFKQWGLVPPEAEKLESELRAQGAKGVKLTGSGSGGFMVALWGNDALQS